MPNQGPSRKSIGEKSRLKLFENGKLFQRTAYKEVRAAFARRFETNHQKEINAAYGDDLDAINKWLTKNVDVKENVTVHPSSINAGAWRPDRWASIAW
jgi:hypothetical protein